MVLLLPEAGEWGRGEDLAPVTPAKSFGSSAIQPVRSTVTESRKLNLAVHRLFPFRHPLDRGQGLRHP